MMKKKMIVFGGVTDDGKPQNSLYVLDFETNEWTLEATKGDSIAARMGHLCVMLEGNIMIVSGGNDNARMIGDMYSLDFNTKTWTKLNPSGDIPLPRTAFNGLLINQYIYTYGGIKYYGDKWGYLDDLHRYDTENNKWEKLAYSGIPMERRANFIVAKTIKDNLLMAHGYWELYNDDAMLLDTSSLTWSLLDDTSSDSIPLGRTHASSISIIKNNELLMYMFGGDDGIQYDDYGFRNDIWVLKASDDI